MIRYKIKKGLVVNTIGQRITIFDSEQSLLYSFNTSASYVFKKIKQKKTSEEIVKGLVKKFSIKNEKAQKDFDLLINDMKKKKIIEALKEE